MYRMLPSRLATAEHVEDGLLRFLADLQLFWPSEPTSAVVTGILLVLQKGLQAAQDMSATDKHGQLLAVKARLQQRKAYFVLFKRPPNLEQI